MEDDQYSQFESEDDPSFQEYLQQSYNIPSTKITSEMIDLAIRFNGDEGFEGVERFFAELADIYHKGIEEGKRQCQN